jgi:hypothetical protein
MRCSLVSLPFVLALALATAPASAVEVLTGTWTGSLKCSGIEGSQPARGKEPVTVEIVDSNPGVQLELLPGGQRLIGYVLPFAPRPQLGILSASSCDYQVGMPAGIAAQGPVRTKPGSDKAALRMYWIDMQPEANTSQLCLLSVRRTSTAAPEINPCSF